ncbi:LysE/ArgO family amino acid transporter [Desulfobotulus sp.]|jgi:L-lysine exporter family protein LysE/ArgO|uniref:LysE/ArgO family amino acid transporter n=1 Tax=Desulfobotulus sp. TaxID=1940337 RepID=UPI002A35F594|nr:LysE/ArgO family amino acid transporter [Desulfobotulus sp.]MDY0161699.1 LysE/ArgO family amino acid transporter [Desulfobotulus sp.]
MLTPALYGFSVCLGLIIAIGAQNAFILTQGIRNNKPLLIALICILCDSLLIGIGVAGLGSILVSRPDFIRWATWGGALFLILYGFRALQSSIRGGASLEIQREEVTIKTPSLILATLGVTFLNPHTYMDTIVLMGGLSAPYAGTERFGFWLGAVCASTLWFFSLTLGARFMAPWFKKASAWRILDAGVCLIMWGIAAALVQQARTL